MQDFGENYDTCALQPCLCLHTVWRGRRCPNWQPTPARTNGGVFYVEEINK